ncbi:MAG: pyruvate,water dikinase, partial [Arenicella sp.]
MKTTTRNIAWFEAIDIKSIAAVGGKNAALGEMFRSLTPLGINVPNGFAITADAYRDLLDSNQLWEKLRALMAPIDSYNVALLAKNSKQARELIRNAVMPPALAKDIKAAYRQLQQDYGQQVSVAVRSSATAEDLPNASFAGQHDTYLNISGEQALLDACTDCMAS